MNQNSGCALVGLGLVLGMMGPGMPVQAMALTTEAVDCIGLT